MAIISSYPFDTIIQDGDAWIGTDVANRRTRQYTAAKVAEYLNIKGKISIGGQMSYKLVNSPRSQAGSIAFSSGGGSGTAFSQISSLNLSFQDLSEQETTAYLQFLVGKSILIADQSDKQSFGWYNVLVYERDGLNSQFYNMSLSYIDGNGTVEVNNYYNMLYFASSSGGGGGEDVSVSNNTGLAVNNNVLSTIYNSTIADNVESVQTGGASPTIASDWKAKTIVQVFDTILFPTVLASISRNKSASLVTSPSTSTVEVVTVVNRTLTAVLDTGQIQNGNGTAGPTLVGGPLSTNAYVFTGTGINTTTQTANTLSIVGSEAILGANTWNVTINHSIGVGDYYNNKGEVGTNLDANRVAGTVTDSTSVITGKYKQFFGPSASAVTSSAEVRGLSNSRFDNTGSFVTPIFNDVKFVIAIPAARTLVSVITSNNETITENFVSSTFNVNDAGGNAVSYDVYTFTSVIALGVTATVIIS